jgi:Lipocalin-like domain
MDTMNPRTTLTLTGLAFLCRGIVLPASVAVGQQKTLKELIVGTWILDSVYDQLQDGKKNDTWGPGVKGIAVFDGSGNMSIQIIAADRSKTASNSPRTPVGQAIGYFGTYAVDEAAKTTTYHIERSTFPQWEGIDSIVSIVFPTDSELDIIGVTPIKDSSLGTFIPHLNFKRAM